MDANDKNQTNTMGLVWVEELTTIPIELKD